MNDSDQVNTKNISCMNDQEWYSDINSKQCEEQKDEESNKNKNLHGQDQEMNGRFFSRYFVAAPQLQS